MLRRVAACLVGLLLALPVLAQVPAAPDKRIVVERDVDFYGADLRAIFDTTFEACRAACVNDGACTAFTFNTRSDSCFPKSGVERREPYAGAVSATVIPRTEQGRRIVRVRESELGFLRPNDLEAARRQAEEMPLTHDTGTGDPEVYLDAANGARARGDRIGALRAGGAAVVLTDSSVYWRAYAEDALAVRSNDRSEQSRLQALALPAAVNAYLLSLIHI